MSFAERICFRIALRRHGYIHTRGTVRLLVYLGIVRQVTFHLVRARELPTLLKNGSQTNHRDDCSFPLTGTRLQSRRVYAAMLLSKSAPDNRAFNDQ